MGAASMSPGGVPKFLTRPAVRGWVERHSGGLSGPSTGRAQRTNLSDLILDRYRRDPSRIVTFAASATPAQYAELAPLVFEFASRKDPMAVELVQEAADAAVRIIDRLIIGGASAISLIGGLAEPLRPWLPSRLRSFLSAPQSDPLDGAILMARQDFESRREPQETQRSSAA